VPSEFSPALDLVLGALEQMRAGGGKLPRASRSSLTQLRPPAFAELIEPAARAPVANKAALLAPIQARVAVCIKCPHLARSRTQTVFGVGNPDAELMFIGEAPGADEDARGEPFVGRAGQLLTKIIETMGFKRADVYIANVLKCGIIGPKVMVALGATAVEGLLGTRGPMHAMRGRWHSHQETPLMITYHPSYLLRNQAPSEKRKVWEDMLQVLERLGRPISEKQRNYFR
jgi:DNA polymerase